jgi:hypothetical protein
MRDDVDTRLVVISIRAYAWLQRLYPAAFRHRFSSEMIAVFAESCREADRRSGAGGVLAVWLATAADLAASALGEHTARAARSARRDATMLAGSRGFSAAALVALVIPLGFLGKLALPAGAATQAPVDLFARTLLHAGTLAATGEALVHLERRRRARRSCRGRSSLATARAFRRLTRATLLTVTCLALGGPVAFDGARLPAAPWRPLVLGGLALPAASLLVVGLFFWLEPLLSTRPSAKARS